MNFLVSVLALVAGLAPVPAATAPTPTATAAVVPASKIVVMVMENKGISQMMNTTNAPFISSMAKKYGYATDFKGMTHPSQPNYVYMVAGENKGITTNAYKQVRGPSILGNTIKAGRTAKVVADGMGSNWCRQTGTSPYAFRHNPWVPFKDERALCEKFDFDYSRFPKHVTNGWIANVEFLIPSNDHNAHDKSIKAADDWFKTNINRMLAGPDYKAGRLAIVITGDEDNKQEDQRILTVLIHPSQNHNVVTVPLDLLSLHRTLARFGHTPPLGKGGTATDMATAFGLPVR